MRVSIKKLIAAILAIAITLTCAAASATTVYTKVQVDRNAVREVLISSGIQEDQMAVFDPILSLVNALGVKVIIVENGIRADLDLNDENALSLVYVSDEKGISLASTLFPNYVLKLQQKTQDTAVGSLVSEIPIIGTSGAEEGAISITPTTLNHYINDFTSFFTETVAPGKSAKVVFDYTAEAGEPAAYQCDIYFGNTDHPAVSATVTISEEDAGMLSVNTDGKTTVVIEDILSGENDAAGGLLTDFLINGFGTLTAKHIDASPEAAELIIGLLVPQSGQQTQKAPEKETEPQIVADPSSWKTMGDVLPLKAESRETSWSDGNYYYYFRYAGTEWLVKADVSEEQKDAVFAVNYGDDDRDEQILAILGPCEIQTVTDLKTFALPQEELDRWIGKTGQDLLDAGWEYNGYHSDETGIHVCMVNGDFQYHVSFAEELITTQVFGEQPENMTTATITGIAFDSKSFHFDEAKYVTP